MYPVQGWSEVSSLDRRAPGVDAATLAVRVGMTKAHDELKHPQAGHRHRDAYDQEYDRGKVKKVKVKYDADAASSAPWLKASGPPEPVAPWKKSEPTSTGFERPLPTARTWVPATAPASSHSSSSSNPFLAQQLSKQAGAGKPSRTPWATPGKNRHGAPAPRH